MRIVLTPNQSLEFCSHVQKQNSDNPNYQVSRAKVFYFVGKEKTTGKNLIQGLTFWCYIMAGPSLYSFTTNRQQPRGLVGTPRTRNEFFVDSPNTNYRCLLIYLRKNHWFGSEFRQSKGGMKGITRAARAEESSIRYNAIQAINF